MGATTKYQLPYPEQSDPPDGPTQIKALADKLDPLILTNFVADAKGDIIVGTAADVMARLAVGADGTVLMADASQASGVRWAGLPGGGATVTFGTNPPASPNSGDIWQFPADAANGIIWTFRYNAASGSAYKWEFVGGSPLFGSAADAISVPNAWTQYLPAFAITRAGQYHVTAFAFSIAGSSQNSVFTLGAGLIPDASPLFSSNAQIFASAFGAVSPASGILTIPANGNVRLLLHGGLAGVTVTSRAIEVRPVRVS